MKKYVFLSAVILAMVAVFTTTGTNPERPHAVALIHYQVNVSSHLPPGQTACPSLVMITDGNGSAVNGSREYSPDKTTYHFYEMGPVTGTRAAVIINLPLNMDILCPMTPQPEVKNTTFLNGKTYKYSMFYGPKPPSPIPMPVPAQ